MPTISVKLSEATRERVQVAALNLGLTPHALMVHAIEEAVAQAETRYSLVEQALAARQHVQETGLLIDAQAFGQYLQSKVRGQTTERPAAQGIEAFLSTPK